MKAMPPSELRAILVREIAALETCLRVVNEKPIRELIEEKRLLIWCIDRQQPSGPPPLPAVPLLA